MEKQRDIPEMEEDEKSATVQDDTSATDSQAGSAEEWTALQAEQKVLKEQNKQLENEIVEIKDKLARSIADLENARRRARKEKEEAIKYASVPLLEKLLPVLDNFERALNVAEETSEDNGLLDGVEMVYRQLLQALSESGLTLIESAGKPFDPYVHNAVMQVESEEHASGIILEELQSGYRFRDRVIRPTMVKVSN